MPKNPWRDDMSPAEFRAYYERKRERLDELSTECDADGCTNTAEYPRRYCSNECKNKGLRAAAKRLEDRLNNDHD